MQNLEHDSNVISFVSGNFPRLRTMAQPFDLRVIRKVRRRHLPVKDGSPICSTEPFVVPDLFWALFATAQSFADRGLQ